MARAWWWDAAMLVAVYGMELSEAAKALGKSYESLRRVSKDPEFIAEVERLRALSQEIEIENHAESAVQKRLAQVEEKAVEAIATLAEGAQSEAVRLNAARTVLELRGHKPPEKVEATHKVIISSKDASNLMAAVEYLRKRREESRDDTDAGR